MSTTLVGKIVGTPLLTKINYSSRYIEFLFCEKVKCSRATTLTTTARRPCPSKASVCLLNLSGPDNDLITLCISEIQTEGEPLPTARCPLTTDHPWNRPDMYNNKQGKDSIVVIMQ